MIDMGIRVGRFAPVGYHIDMGIRDAWSGGSNFYVIIGEHEANLDETEKKAVIAFFSDSHSTNEHLDRAISKNKLKEPLVTYSGMQRSPWDNGHSMFHTATPMSSSLDPLVAHQFSISYGNDAAHIAKITNMKGSAGLLVGANSNLTPSPCEMEYIIPRNTNFVVHPEPEEVKDNNGKLTHYIWNMRRC